MSISPPASTEGAHRTAPPCSAVWDDAETAAWGTASPATFWVALEQPGPWGAKAFRESRLDPELGARLERETTAAGGRALLIRAVADHREDAAGAPRRVFVAGGMPGGAPWLLEGLITDPAALLDLPWARLAVGDAEAAVDAREVLPELRPCSQPLLLVCTNGKRDTCCAVRGRKVAAYAAGQRDATVWECTHTGGHRFAPTGLVLPGGATYARLDGPLAVAALDAAAAGRVADGALGGRHLRGLAHLDGPSQAAEAFVRAETGETGLSALRVMPTESPGRPTDAATPDGHAHPDAATGNGSSDYTVTHIDGHSRRVTVTATTVEGPPVSCGGKRVASTSYDVRPA